MRPTSTKQKIQETIRFLVTARSVLCNITKNPEAKKYILEDASDAEILYYLMNRKKIPVPIDFLSESYMLQEAILQKFKSFIKGHSKAIGQKTSLNLQENLICLHGVSTSKKFLSESMNFSKVRLGGGFKLSKATLFMELGLALREEERLLDQFRKLRSKDRKVLSDQKYRKFLSGLAESIATLKKYRKTLLETMNSIIDGNEEAFESGIKSESFSNAFETVADKVLLIKNPGKIPYQTLLTIILYKCYQELDSKLEPLYRSCQESAGEDEDALAECILKAHITIQLKKISYLNKTESLCSGSDLPHPCTHMLMTKRRGLEDKLRFLLNVISGAPKEEEEISESRVLEAKGNKAWSSLPRGWTKKSVKKAFTTMTKDRKRKIRTCVNKMKDKVSDPWAFCASMGRVAGYKARRAKTKSKKK
jgi:hypothetical protein